MTDDQRLAGFRAEIDALDRELVATVSKRLAVCARVAQFKRAHGIPMMQPNRVDAVKRRCAALGETFGVSGEFIERLYALIIDHACELEDRIIDAVEVSR